MAPQRYRIQKPRTLGSHTLPWENAQVPAPLYYGGMLLARVVLPRAKWIAWGIFFIVAWSKVGLILGLLLGVIFAFAWEEVRVRLRTRRAGGAAGGWSERRELVRFEDDIRTKWPEVCDDFGLVRKKNNAPPVLRDLQLTPSGSVTARVVAAEIRKPESEFTKRASEFGSVMECDGGVRIEPTRAGEVLFTFHRKDAMSRVLPLADLPVAPRGRFAYGITETQSPATMAMNLSWLCVGVTGSGKSSAQQAALASLLLQQQPVWLYISDTKRQEWKKYKPFLGQTNGNLTVKAYTDDPAESEEIIKLWLKNMGTRQRATNDRNWTPYDAENPLCIFVADEFMDLYETVRLGVKSPLAKGIRTGRSTGYPAWLGSQLAQKEAIALRDLIPQRTALRTQDEMMTRMALGVGENGGALSHEISPDQPGKCYAFIDGGKRAVQQRVAYVDDGDIDYLKKGLLPPEVLANTRRQLGEVRGPHWTYVFFRENGRCLYVGETNDIDRRFKEHATDKPWWQYVDHTRTQTQEHPSVKVAKEREKQLIAELAPTENDQHNHDNPDRTIRRFARRMDQRTGGKLSSPRARREAEQERERGEQAS